MFCTKCGAPIEDGSVFCTQCGAKFETDIPTPAAPAEPTPAAPVNEMGQTAYTAPTPAPMPAQTGTVEPKRRGSFLDLIRKHKLPVIIGAGALALIVILIVVMTNVAKNYSSGRSNEADLRIASYYDMDDRATVFFYDGKETGRVDESLYETTTMTIGTAEMHLYANREDNYELYCVTRSGADELDNKVYSYVVSADASVIIYNSDDGLYRYRVSDGKETEIAEEGYYLCVSPDGNTVLFLNSDSALCLNSEDNVLAEEGYYPFAVSNDARYIYVVDEDQDDIYLMNKKGVTTKIDDFGDCIFNSDLSEMMYYVNDRTYISVKGGDKQKVNSSLTYPTAVASAGKQISMSCSTFAERGLILGMDSFANQTYYSGDEIVFVDKSWECDKLESFDSIVNYSNNYTYYVRNSKLYRLANKAGAEGEVVAKKVNSAKISFSSDGSKIYYVDEDETLCVVSGDKVTELEDDVYAIGVTGDDKLFVLYDYDRSTAKLGILKGSEVEKIESDVLSFAVSRNGVFFYTTEDYDSMTVYYTDGKTINELVEEAAGYIY